MSVNIPSPVARRALTRCTPGVEGCLISTYSRGSHGYAQIGWHDHTAGKRRMTTAHRAAWVAANGCQIPSGMTVDHACHVRTCVNPDHLRLLSNVENARDNRQVKGVDGRDQLPGVALLGLTCQRGHQLIGWPSGAYGCHECTGATRRRKEAKRRAYA